MNICVDASVVVRLLNNNDYPDVARKWREAVGAGGQVVAPSLLRYEVVNALYKSIRFANISPTTAQQAIQTLMDLPIDYLHDDFLHRDALSLAVKYRLGAAYDAHYVALAQHLGAELWTADKRLYNAVHPHLDLVRLVDNA